VRLPKPGGQGVGTRRCKKLGLVRESAYVERTVKQNNAKLVPVIQMVVECDHH
jgi:hypothetical protein